MIEPQQGATYADQLALAKAAEGLGFSALFRSDHFLAINGDRLPGPTAKRLSNSMDIPKSDSSGAGIVTTLSQLGVNSES
jgi:hypothetical protein